MGGGTSKKKHVPSEDNIVVKNAGLRSANGLYVVVADKAKWEPNEDRVTHQWSNGEFTISRLTWGNKAWFALRQKREFWSKDDAAKEKRLRAEMAITFEERKDMFSGMLSKLRIYGARSITTDWKERARRERLIQEARREAILKDEMDRKLAKEAALKNSYKIPGENKHNTAAAANLLMPGAGLACVNVGPRSRAAISAKDEKIKDADGDGVDDRIEGAMSALTDGNADATAKNVAGNWKRNAGSDGMVTPKNMKESLEKMTLKEAKKIWLFGTQYETAMKDAKIVPDNPTEEFSWKVVEGGWEPVPALEPEVMTPQKKLALMKQRRLSANFQETEVNDF